MNRGIAVLLVLPFGAVQAETLIAEYEGTITHVGFDWDAYEVGDPVSGRLFIDTLLAGQDDDPAVDIGTWAVDPGPDQYGPNFIDAALPISGLSTDRLLVRNNRPSGVDAYFIVDEGDGASGRHLMLNAQVRGFLDDADIHQSFELTSADADDDDERLSGSVQLWSEAFADFVVSRLTVRPARCFAD